MALEAEVAARMGMVPNFFQSDETTFEPVNELWGFAQAAYLDNPLPPLFKERLFVHLSRFCRARYCIVRHVGFLLGQGNVAGAPDVPPQSVDDVVALLRYPGQVADGTLAQVIERVTAHCGAGVPEMGTELERDTFVLTTLLFTDPLMAERARRALGTLLGSKRLELLIAFLAFVRTAHYWTLTHASIRPETDITQFLDEHATLAEIVLSDHDVASSVIGEQLFSELEELRAERDEREALRQALSERDEALRRQNLLIDELNHRVKNTLAVVQSMARQTLKRVEMPAEARTAFNDRLRAIASGHDLLTREHWGAVTLDHVVDQTIEPFRAASGTIAVEGPPIRLQPKTSLSVVMAMHELATNAVKYGALSVPSGRVSVSWDLIEPGARGDIPRLRFVWQEKGGPPVVEPAAKGFGSLLIERSLAVELRGTVDLTFDPDGVRCTIDAPLPEDIANGGAPWGAHPELDPRPSAEAGSSFPETFIMRGTGR